MKQKFLSFLDAARRKKDAFAVKAKIEAGSAAATLKDTSGGNKTTEVLLGIVAAVVIGGLLINSATGYFTNTFWPNITSKVNGIFS